MKCSKCGAENEEGFKFCDACGTLLSVPTSKDQKPSAKRLAFINKKTVLVSDTGLTVRAIQLIKQFEYTSIAELQRTLRITWSTAWQLMNDLEKLGLVRADEGSILARVIAENADKAIILVQESKHTARPLSTDGMAEGLEAFVGQESKHTARPLSTDGMAEGLEAFVGQDLIRNKVRFQIELAKKKGIALKHILLCGPDGEGKAYLAECIANEMQVKVKSTEARNIERPGDLMEILTNLHALDILLIKHIEHLNQPCGEVLAPAMTDFVLDMTIGKGRSARSIHLKLPHFTLVGTTPNQGAVREPFRDNFDVVLDLAPYDQKSLSAVILFATHSDKPALDTSGAIELAKRANGSLRAARKLARQVKDYAVVNNHNIVDEEVVLKAFGVFGVDIERTERDKTGVAFELKCMNLLRRRNFDVNSTKRTSDGGIDLVAWSNDPVMRGKYVVQCKDWSNPVGAPVVRDLFGVVHAEDANKGILITASSFTQEALDFAAGKRLELIDGKQLNYLLAQ